MREPWSCDARSCLLGVRRGLSLPTIQHMEKLGAERSQAGNVQRLQQAMEAAGIEFIPENGGGAGVRLKARAG